MIHHDKSGSKRLLERCLGLALLAVLACAALLGQGSGTDSWAATIYSYIDDQGNLAYTDDPEKIPEKYRAKVKTHERPSPGAKSSSVMDSVQQTVKEQAKSFGFKIPSVEFDMKRLTPSRLGLLNYAGVAAIVLLLMMYLFKESPMVRLLALGLLIVLGITTPVLMYSSEGGPMDTMKKKAVEAGQAQDTRLQQIPQ